MVGLPFAPGGVVHAVGVVLVGPDGGLVHQL